MSEQEFQERIKEMFKPFVSSIIDMTRAVDESSEQAEGAAHLVEVSTNELIESITRLAVKTMPF